MRPHKDLYLRLRKRKVNWKKNQGLRALVFAFVRHSVVEKITTLTLKHVDFAKHHFDVLKLLSQRGATLAKHIEEAVKLRLGVAGAAVHVENLLDFGQREAETLAAQLELQARSVCPGIHPGASGAVRGQQALIFVKADGARRDVEFARQLGNRICAFGVHECCAARNPAATRLINCFLWNNRRLAIYSVNQNSNIEAITPARRISHERPIDAALPD